jgi:hypothetical protein
LQNYVELEAGGVTAFQQLISVRDGVTHYWKLRNFAEGQQEELILALSPQGDFVSFALTLPAEQPGPALEEETARELAEAGARQHMGERFNAYQPLETRVVRQVSGRADYNFTYEHDSLQVGEARFRLLLTVAGDQLVAVDTFKHIPQAFEQRFGELRALNNYISQVAGFIFAGLFVLGGLVGGGIWLHRRHQLHWRPALVPAAIVATGLGVSRLMSLPSVWMDYRTTETVSNFLSQQFYLAVLIVVGLGLLFTFIYAVAEGLSRMAFAQQPRLNDVWRIPVAASPDMLGRVLGGYAWAALALAYVVLFILLSTHWLGWWIPTGLRTDPNLLSNWRPALVAVFTALQAGMWEECLFRAVPLALAVIIGRRFNLLKPLVISTLMVQALVFAGAHADYPQLPGYSRLIELFIPALVYGLIYLRYGLIPCILAHFTYNLVLMSLPLFMADAPSLWLDRVLVIMAGGAPLALVLYARWRQGAWLPLAEQWRNGIQSPPQATADTERSAAATVQDPQFVPSPLALRSRWQLMVAGVAVVLITVNWFEPPLAEWPGFDVNRAQAIAIAEAELDQRGIKLEGEWRRSVTTQTDIGDAHRFVWQTSGRDVYQHLIGHHLDTPYWVVTWRRFDGPVEERTEQWTAWLYPDGRLHQLVHNLPEGAPGAVLTRAQAVALARDWMLSLNWPDPLTLEEKAVEEIKRPERTDWQLSYIDRSAYDHANGQAVLALRLSGDEVTGYVRGIDVPDEWRRLETAKEASKSPFYLGTSLAMGLLVMLSLSGFVGKYSSRPWRVKIALPWIVIIALSSYLVSVLWIDPALRHMDNTMSWMVQLALLLFGYGLNGAFLCAVIFLVVQLVYAEPPSPGAAPATDFYLGATLALGLSGLTILRYWLLPGSYTPGPYAADYGTLLPWLTVIGNGLKGMMPIIWHLLLAIGLLRFCKNRLYHVSWRTLLIGVAAVIWIITRTLAGDDGGVAFVDALLHLTKLWLVVELIRRQQLGVALVFAVFTQALTQLGVGHALYPLAWLHGLLSFTVLLGVAYGLVKHWHKHAEA